MQPIYIPFTIPLVIIIFILIGIIIVRYTDNLRTEATFHSGKVVVEYLSRPYSESNRLTFTFYSPGEYQVEFYTRKESLRSLLPKGFTINVTQFTTPETRVIIQKTIPWVIGIAISNEDKQEVKFL